MALKYCHCATQKVAKFRMQLNVAGGDKRDTLPRHYLCPCKVKAWRGKKGECFPSFLFYSLRPSCSHYCRSCLLFALLVRETGSVLCWIVRWECFGDAITFFIGHYDVAHGELSQSTTPNTPIKIPYNEIRPNAHPISSTTSKQPTPASPLELENLFMG